ncbi:MAG TPA: aldose 1-epimerase [Solirubrobacteraceae bacterium]
MGSPDGFDSITVASPDASTKAEFVPDANMLCCSLTHNGSELLHTGGGVRAYAERGKTMGIPLLHPWANRLAGFRYQAAGQTVTLRRGDPRIPVDPGGLPIHGVLPGLLHWQVQSGASAGELRALLRWEGDELLEVFPFPHELHLEVMVGSGELVLATTLKPTASAQVPVSFGYHPYGTIPGSSRQAWSVELAAFRRLVLDERMIPTSEREPGQRRSFRLGETSLDDGFDALTVPAEFSVTARTGGMAVEFRSGYHFAQVYAPPGQDFICFEPMTAAANALCSGDGLQLAEPGEEYRAEFAIRVLADPGAMRG